jgi:hypothetical protein
MELDSGTARTGGDAHGGLTHNFLSLGHLAGIINFQRNSRSAVGYMETAESSSLKRSTS